MMTPDNSASMIASAVSSCKSAVRLTPETQDQPDSGRSAAPDPGSVDQSAAVPSGSPGK